MDYKGQRVLCDEDDLIIINGLDDDFFVGYYGAGGVFVELDCCKTEEDAIGIFELIYNTLMENNTYYNDDWCEKCRHNVEDCICNENQFNILLEQVKKLSNEFRDVREKLIETKKELAEIKELSKTKSTYERGKRGKYKEHTYTNGIETLTETEMIKRFDIVFNSGPTKCRRFKELKKLGWNRTNK